MSSKFAEKLIHTTILSLLGVPAGIAFARHQLTMLKWERVTNIPSLSLQNHVIFHNDFLIFHNNSNLIMLSSGKTKKRRRVIDLKVR